jgi:ERCC4-type nuclease
VTGLTIQIDSREKARAITKIVRTFDQNGIKHYVSKLYVGDYMNLDNPRLVIDRKQNLSEVCANVCQDHDRFRAELIRAQEQGIKVIILVEHGEDVKTLQDVIWWVNPRLKNSPKAMTGERLFKIMQTLERKYDCVFKFCTKEQTGAEIVRLLNNDK